jgi:hypothetical protein
VKRVDVVICFEGLARELDVCCAVAALAERHLGLSVEIFQWPRGVPDALRTLRPRLVLMPHSYQVQSSIYEGFLYEWRDAIFANLAWEQITYPGSRGAKLPRDEFSQKYVLHHAWSREWFDLLTGCGVPAEHIFLNGNPGHMLYRPPYFDHFKGRDELAGRHGLDPDKRWLFFPENYNWAFYTDVELYEMLVKTGTKEDDARMMREYCQKALREALRWCAAEAADGRTEVILRPRPAVTVEAFREVLSEVVPNAPRELRCLKDGTIREWIKASDVVVSSYSTSLIDAAVVGRPVYMLEPLPLPEIMKADWYRLVPRITDRAGLEAAVVDGPPSDAGAALRAWAVDAMGSRGDALWGLARWTGDLLAGRAARPPGPVPRSCVAYRGRVPAPAWAIYAYRKWRYRRWRHDPASTDHFQARFSLDFIPPEELRERRAAWARTLRDYRPADVGGAAPRARVAAPA